MDDLVLRKYRTCIFVKGCFWHGHNVDLRFDDFLDEPNASRVRFTIANSECCKIPNTNREFWVEKIPKFHLTMHCYLCSLQTEALHLNEHEAAKWLTIDELDSVRWLPADLEVVGKIKSIRKS